MYDDYHFRIIEEKTNFLPQDGNSVVEIGDDKPGGGRSFEEKDVEDALIPAWLEETTSGIKQQPLLRLMLCSPEHHDNDAKILPLPVSDDSLKRIMAAWRLPTEFLRMLLSTMPIVTTFSVNQEKDSRPLEGLMLRSGRSRDWNYCLAVLHDAGTGVTNAIVHGLEQGEIEKLKACLQQSLELAYHPMLLPVTLVELKIHYFATLLERRARGLDDIEYETGMRHGFSNRPERNTTRPERLRSRELLDFDLLTQKLTGLAGTFAFCDLTFQNGLRSLELVQEAAGRIQYSGPARPTEHHPTMPQSLCRRIEYLKALIAGAQNTRRLLELRTQAQIQTVYSLIAQKDALDTKKIAVLTRRDSTDMRIIAAVTLVFLPGTFTAALFGANFFDFTPKEPSHVVSSWMWLYWVITVGLTLVVLLAWLILSRRNKQRMHSHLADTSTPQV